MATRLALKTITPLLGIAGYSGSGKTTLLKKLIPLLRQEGIRLALIKHTHHEMEIDTPGKDSYELRKAGAEQTIVASDLRWALITETPECAALDLYYLASCLEHRDLDLILVEGFKHEPIPKIALYRSDTGRNYRDLIDQHVIALASDQPVDIAVPWLDINQPEQVVQFIQLWLIKGQ
ncbi:MAG: molybdopterin-guanine dinucleotide biosynthesis protein MobB [Enterobacteriaceae bacterium]